MSNSSLLYHTAVIALGSNLGDRFRNIELALRLLEQPCGKDATVDVLNTSFLYETSPMYVTDQPAFLNCACVIETDLKPLKLLALLKTIEDQVGRVPSQRFGPRAVDLDIVFYDDKVVDTRPQQERDRLDNLTGQLVVPHPRLPERDFVLRPLNDMIPDYEHPVLKKTVKTLLSELPINPDSQPMLKVIPFPRYPAPGSETLSELQVPDTLTYWTHPQRTERRKSATIPRHQTQIMAIINVTPDSFSDGTQYESVPAALEHARGAVEVGASVVDIGGYSTRPGAQFVSTEQEIARVQPVVEAIRNSGEEKLKNTIISVDTFRPGVAEAAVQSGANCINDVCAFTGPEWWKGDQATDEAEEYMRRMKEVARKYAVPVVLMHSRGDAGENKDYTMYSYAEEAVVEGVRIELGDKVERVVRGKGGLRRWMVIVDIGIGFSKTVEGNLELLRSATRITEKTSRNPLAGFPQLLGASRKSFLGNLLAEGDRGRKTEPKERTWATAATVACSVQQEALVVRVHDVKEMADVVRVSDAIWS
ncbi:Dihydropteroate synthase-like protein [Amanita muscaria]